ncbi:MAG TPA: lantibiotic dehydratase, partial [Umezawaea sp.]|nr:lantibiotic dehydratase [Umezawaea sp.]
MSEVRLGAGRWALWRDVALRSAGFPAELVTRLGDAELAAAADADPTGPEYDRAHRAGLERQSRVLEAIARSPVFREAVAWQNPQLVLDCLDRLTADKPRNARRRGHEMTVAGHVQRYALKNDTIGFFGPVGWATLLPTEPDLTVRPGAELLARRTTYFEGWAVDKVARVLAELPEMYAWLKPTVVSTHLLRDGAVHRPRQSPIPVSAGVYALLQRCDGERTVRDLVDGSSGIVGGYPDEAAIRPVLERLRSKGVLRLDLEQPVQTWPEHALRRRLLDVGDDAVRTRALATLDEFIAARDVIAAASGDADKVLLGLSALDEMFLRVTG